MKKKSRILKIAILCFMVLFSSYYSSFTFAYWSRVELSDVTQETLIIGEWEQGVTQWDPNEFYSIGDRVINNGVEYTAKKDGPSREPGVDSGWKSEWS